MLQTLAQPEPGRTGPTAVDGALTIDSALSAMRRQARVMLAVLALALGLAALYLLLATPYYSASTDILIDGRTLGATDSKESSQLILANNAIDSQVELMSAQSVIDQVIDKFDLARDPEFNGEGGLISRLLSWARPGGDADGTAAEQLRRRVFDNVVKGLDVKRQDKTFLLEVKFTSRDPQKAANLANAIADAYIADQLQSKYDATRRANGWLQDRIFELKKKAIDTDRSVQEFRQAHGLIEAGGRLINNQSLSEINTQLSTAHAQTTAAEARHAQIKAVIDARQMDAPVPDALVSPVISQLRTRYFISAKRLSELQKRVKPGHAQVLALQNELKDYEDQMFAELERIAKSVASEVAASREREEALRVGRDAVAGANASDNMTLVNLRELEREAESYRDLYQSFLQRNHDLIQQQSYPVTEARVVTRAVAPKRPSHPRTLLVIGAGLVLGIASAVGLAIFRENRDLTFKTAEQVAGELDLECLGLQPTLDAGASRRGIATTSVSAPLSRLSDTLRSVKVALDLSQGGEGARVLGVVSAMNGEGKSVTASNFALLLGSMGARTLLIDGDLRRGGLTRALAPEAANGLLDVVEGRLPLADAGIRLPEGGVLFLPSVNETPIANSSEVLRSEGMAALIDTASEQFDYILIDLPPLGCLIDARAIEPLVPSYLLVVEWGGLARASIRKILDQNYTVRNKLIGAVLNKVDTVVLNKYVGDRRELARYREYQ